MTSQEKLIEAVEFLRIYYRHTPYYKRTGWCLRDTRAALDSVGLRLPWAGKPDNTAWACFNHLRSNPANWGWVQISHPLPKYVLAFWGACGYLKDGRMAGHIGILDTEANIIYSATESKHSRWWGARLKGAFVPK
jgi:hypothetical protein